MKIDIKVLQARHPAEFAAGVATERDRVAALLHAGDVSGARDLALTAIRSGADLDARLSAQFLDAGMNRRDQDLRADDEIQISLAADGARGTQTSAEAGKSDADIVADYVCANLNK